MPTVHYRYTAHVSRPGFVDFVYRPLLEVRVFGESESDTFRALVDSGTEVSIMNSEIAEALGIDLKDCEKATVGGIGGKKPGFLHPIKIQVEGLEDVYEFTAVFVEDLESDYDIILGQHDFFRNFEICFKRDDCRFSLTNPGT